MNFNFDFDDGWPTGPCEFLPSPEPRRTDTVRWLNSQPPLPALQEIMVQKPRSDRDLKPETAWPWYPSYEEELVASTSFNLPSGKKRPLGRTNSSSRLRPYSKQASNLPSLSTAPAGLMSSKAHGVSASKGGRDPLDENIAMRAALTDRAKRKERISPRPQAVSTVSRPSTLHATSTRELQSVHAKGKEKARGLEEEIHEEGINILPLLSSSSSTAPSSANTSMTDLESLDILMDVDVEHQHEHSPSIYNRNHPTLDNSRPSDSHPASSCRGDATFDPVTPAAAVPRFHPLLRQPQPRQQQHSHLGEAPPQAHVQAQQQLPLAPKRRAAAPPPQNAPLFSQTSRPPPLGMRRVHTLPSAAQQQPLPTRQKAFKPPTVSQQPPAAKLHGQPSCPPVQLVRKESMNSVTEENMRLSSVAAGAKSSFQATQAVLEEKPHGKRGGRGPSRGPSPDLNLEADSSFGDISFDMDALEETMRKYD